jgi:sugar/nucleoside kinase (ribokinase family)
MTDARLLCCGLTTWDIVQVVDRLPGPDEKIQALELRAGVGGPAANAARTSAALGVRTRLVTALGSGSIAELARADLAAAGVEVVDLALGLDAGPAISTVLVTRGTGQRAVVSTNAVAAPRLHQLPDRVLDGITALLVDGHHLELAIRLARDARKAGLPTVLDGGSWKVGQEALLDAIQLAVVSGDFVLPAFLGGRGIDTPDDALRRIAARGPSFVARTAGAGPAYYLHGSEEHGQPALLGRIPVSAPPGRIVDTLGAGDVLHGAFAAAIAVEWTPEDALGYAMELATASVSHPGALGWTTDAALLARVSLRS